MTLFVFKFVIISRFVDNDISVLLCDASDLKHMFKLVKMNQTIKLKTLYVKFIL